MHRPFPSVASATAVVAALAVLAVGLVGVAVHEPSARVAAGTRPPVSSAIGRVLPELQSFVERTRGLDFLHPVDVRLVDDAEFDQRLGKADEEARTEIVQAQNVLQAMGLLPSDIDLVRIVESFAGQAILGFYDAETDELVVRGTEATASVRSTLVHELTHALEDQHFDLDRPDLGDEASAGFTALAEGSAGRVEEAFIASLTEKEREQAARDEEARSRGVPENVPEVVQAAFGFPYAVGPGFVHALLRAGGQPRLDGAFRNPPVSSEQVLDPARYLAGDRPRTVPTPRPDRPPFDDGEIGELFLILMLRAELPDGVAREAARGWGGDHYVAWKDGSRTCVRMTLVMDSPADTRELTAALAAWAARRPRSAAASGTSLRTCG